MRNRFLLLLLLPALMPEALGRSWQLEPSTLKLATEVLDRNLTAAPSYAKVPVDRDHQAEFYELNFQVPRGPDDARSRRHSIGSLQRLHGPIVIGAAASPTTPLRSDTDCFWLECSDDFNPIVDGEESPS